MLIIDDNTLLFIALLLFVLFVLISAIMKAEWKESPRTIQKRELERDIKCRERLIKESEAWSRCTIIITSRF